jgi:hypothetical protein
MPGQTSASFTITTNAVTSSQTVDITARLGSSSQLARLTVNPPAQTLPDLVITSVTFPPSALIGSTQTFAAVVRNNGAAAAAAFRVGLYYSTDSTITTGDALVGACNISSLAAGSSMTCSGPLPVPTALSAGTYWGGAIADDLSQVAESNESNNALATSSTVTLMQAQAASPWASADYTLNGTLTVEGQNQQVLITTIPGNRYTSYVALVSQTGTNKAIITMAFQKANASANTIMYTSVDGSGSNYVNPSRSLDMEPIISGTMTLTLTAAKTGSCS